MMSFLSSQRISVGVCSLFLLSACGGGGGDSTNTSASTTSDTGVASSVMGTGTTSSVSNTANFSINELVDPNPSSRVEYGYTVKVLASGNIVVSKPDDNANGMESVGSIHLYEAGTQKIIATIHGDDNYDSWGSNGIYALPNGNFIIASLHDRISGASSAGSVKLINGVTGAQISSFEGVNTSDRLGDAGITILANNHFLIASHAFNPAGVSGAGSVMLVSGDTGLQIGSTISGQSDKAFSQLNVLPLGNGQFTVISPMSDNAGLEDVGAIRLFDETTGDQVGSTLVGEAANYTLGGGFDTQVLSNGNFVVHSVNVDHPSSIRLINGENNTQIGSPLIEPSLGVSSRHVITPLNNGHYVLVTPSDDTNGKDTGSVKLVSGTTNQVIGDAVNGAQPEDFLGDGGVRALATGNYVVTSFGVDVGGIENAGSLQLIDGTTGARIGMPVLGDAQDDFDQATLTALDNGNFVFAAPRDDVGGIENAGSMTLFDGATGAAIGQPVTGANENAQFANRSIIALSNNNVAIVSSLEVFGDEAVGSVRLLNGVTGQWVGGPTVGKTVEDFDLVSLTELSGNRLMIAASSYDIAGAVDAGAFITLQTNTSNTIGDPIVGSNKWDFSQSSVNEAADGSFYVLTSPNAKNHGFDSAGKILVVTP